MLSGSDRDRLRPVVDSKRQPAELPTHSVYFLAPRLNNLPIPLTALIGRKQELARVRALLASGSLLTLTGVGGSGKTRLALALATEVAEEYQDGVCWVNLAGLLDASMLSSTVGEALGLHEIRGQSFDQVLLDYLAPRHFLLILDNCEHLIYPCAQLGERLLSTCPHLKLLTTSRESLAIGGEIVWSVPALSMPDPPFIPAQLMQYDAPRLFMARASAVRPDFALSENNAEAVGQICRRLDGLPLAIELAAARINVLSVEQIAARLDDRFELLTAGSRTALPRHQALRSALDWSFDLLTAPEQILFRRLAVFADGFTIDAAESVCTDAGKPAQVSLHSIVDLLAHLVDKSLLLVHHGRSARYRMLATIRQYALEKLERAQELTTLSERHFNYFMSLAEEAKLKLISAEQKAALEQLDAERDNLAAAFDWSLASGNPVRALHLAWVLWRFWHIRGYLREGRGWLEKILAQTESLGKTADRARALAALGVLTWLQGDLSLARTELQEAADIAQACGESLCLAEARKWLGFLATDQGKHQQARDLVEKSVQRFEEAGDRWSLAHSLFVLGRVHMDLGEIAKARRLYDSSLDIFRELGDQWGMSLPIGHLGLIAEQMGDAAAARRLLEERLRLAEELGSKRLIEFAVRWLGIVAYRSGEYQEAVRRFRQALELAWQTGLKASASDTLEVLGWLAQATHQPARAARVMGAAGALRARLGVYLFDLAGHAHKLSALRAELGEDEFNAAWAEGEAMTWEQVLECALQVQAPASDRRKTRRQTAKHEAGGLSAREREVAILIAEGKSNRQIAEALVISERTVTTHVANTLSKLGFNSRAQVAAWVVQKGLLEKQSKE